MIPAPTSAPIKDCNIILPVPGSMYANASDTNNSPNVNKKMNLPKDVRKKRMLVLI